MQGLLYAFKALGDENRLRIVGLLHEGERNVTELADLLDLTAPTVSHHLSKLRAIGLVNIDTRSNQRVYHLNDGTLSRLKKQFMELETLASKSESEVNDAAWIDDLNLDDADKKTLRDYTHNGQLKQIPSKEKKLLAVLRWLATKFEPDVKYTEKQVNAIITPCHEDYATLRRDLVEYGFLRRERGGGQYWLAPE